jgi:hypothetical protein
VDNGLVIEIATSLGSSVFTAGVCWGVIHAEIRFLKEQIRGLQEGQRHVFESMRPAIEKDVKEAELQIATLVAREERWPPPRGRR